jgi:ABC-type branched-subunit amino acid transport system substrate-binding protein
VKLGVKVSQVQMLSTDTDLSGVATDIIGRKPDVVYHDEVTDQLPGLVKEMYDLGYKGKTLAIAGLADTSLFKICGNGCVGALAATTYVPSTVYNKQPFMAQWLPKAQKVSGQQAPPEGFAYGYLTGQFLIAGMKAALKAHPGASLTRASLLQGLHSITSLPATPFGPIVMTDDQGYSPPTFVQFNAQGQIVTWNGTVAGVDMP